MHESGNHSNGYGHPKAAITRSFSGAAGNRFGSIGKKTWNNFRLQRELQLLSSLVVYLIKSDIINMHTLMTSPKQKQVTHYHGSYAIGGKSALNKCFYHFNVS
jgi:hypothetical protein